MADSPTFQIPKDVIEPIIQAHIASAVTTALGGHQALVAHAINAALNMKVNDRGERDTYGYRESKTFVEWLMHEAIQKAAKEAVKEAFASQHEAMKKALANELRKSASPFAKQIIAGIIGKVIDGNMLDYCLKVEVAQVER